MSRRPRLFAYADRTSIVLAALNALLCSPSIAFAQRASATPPADVFASSSNCQVVLQQKSAAINAQHDKDWKACGGASACIRAANAKKADALKQANADLRLCQANGGTTRPPTARETPASGPQPLDTIVATPARDRQPVEIPTNSDPVQGPSPTRPRSRDYGPLVTPSVPSTPQSSTPSEIAPGRTPGGETTPGTGPDTDPSEPDSGSRDVPPWDNRTGGGQPGTWKHVTVDGKDWAIYTDTSGQPWAFRPAAIDPAGVPGRRLQYRLDTRTLHMEPWGTDGLRLAAYLVELNTDGTFNVDGIRSQVIGRKLTKPSTTP